jgi:hypothetical protein
MIRPIALSILVFVAAGEAHAAECALGAADWSRPRSGEMVRELAPVAECVRAWHRDPQQRLVLIHVAGEDGSLWAVELRDWLVALGVPSSAIELRAVGVDPDVLTLRVEPRAVVGG